MSNSYFSFKQFTIHQDQCGMKVSTDACIQGAWTPLPPTPIRILDIGTGTGLLSLMLAQRNPLAYIDAIEIDKEAAAQAATNVVNSPFSDRIKVHHIDAKDFTPTAPYDLIICNPPFFKDSLLGPDSGRNTARHSLHLNQSDLLHIMENCLSDIGYISILWPVPEMDAWNTIMEKEGWKSGPSISAKDKAVSRIHRIIGTYCKTAIKPNAETLIIKNADGSYTDNFRQLLSSFYLHI